MARVAQELAGQVHSWLERAADHVLDRMQPPELGLIYEGGGESRERPQSLADRLRTASKGLNREEITAHLAVIRQGREVKAQDKARELGRVKADDRELS